MDVMTLWTLGRKQCVLCIDPPKYDYALRIVEDDAVLLEQVIGTIDDVLPTAMTWERQYSARVALARETAAIR